jgi:hypothetical protein
MRSGTRSLLERERSSTICAQLRAEQREQRHGQHVLLRVLAAQLNLFNTAPEQLARLACAIGGTALRSAHGRRYSWVDPRPDCTDAINTKTLEINPRRENCGPRASRARLIDASSSTLLDRGGQRY